MLKKIFSSHILSLSQLLTTELFLFFCSLSFSLSLFSLSLSLSLSLPCPPPFLHRNFLRFTLPPLQTPGKELETDSEFEDTDAEEEDPFDVDDTHFEDPSVYYGKKEVSRGGGWTSGRIC